MAAVVNTNWLTDVQTLVGMMLGEHLVQNNSADAYEVMNTHPENCTPRSRPIIWHYAEGSGPEGDLYEGSFSTTYAYRVGIRYPKGQKNVRAVTPEKMMSIITQQFSRYAGGKYTYSFTHNATVYTDARLEDFGINLQTMASSQIIRDGHLLPEIRFTFTLNYFTPIGAK